MANVSTLVESFLEDSPENTPKVGADGLVEEETSEQELDVHVPVEESTQRAAEEKKVENQVVENQVVENQVVENQVVEERDDHVVKKEQKSVPKSASTESAESTQPMEPAQPASSTEGDHPSIAPSSESAFSVC